MVTRSAMQQLPSSNQLVSNGMWSSSLQLCTSLLPTPSAWPYEILHFYRKSSNQQKSSQEARLSPRLRVRISCHMSTSKMIRLVPLVAQVSWGTLYGQTDGATETLMTRTQGFSHRHAQAITPHPRVHTLIIHTLSQLQYTHKTPSNPPTCKHTHISTNS